MKGDDRGDPGSDEDGNDSLWAMGGLMDVWDVEERPRLIAE